MSGVRVSWIKAITCSYCIAFSLMDLPLGHRPFPASVTSQMGKAKPTLPGEIETNTRYANIIYLVYKWQSWSVLASEKSREKPKGRKVIKETLCWFPRSSLSSWRSWDSSNVTWDLGYLVSMPTVLSSHFPISMAFLTVWDSFLRTIFEEKMLQSFSYSSSRLGSKQHLQSSSCNPHSLHCATPPWVCLHFCSMVQLPKAAAGRDQLWPDPISAVRHPRYDWELVFPLFSPCPRQRQPTWTRSKLTGLLFEKGRGDNGHSGALPHVTGREEPALVTGSRQLWADEGGFVSKQKLLFVQPMARGCSLCVMMEGALCCSHPLAVMPSVTHGLWRKDHPSCLQKHQITPRLCWRGAIVFQAGKSPGSNKP